MANSLSSLERPPAGLAIFRLRSLNGQLAAVRAGGEGMQVGSAFLAVGTLVGVDGSTLGAGHNNRGG